MSGVGVIYDVIKTIVEAVKGDAHEMTVEAIAKAVATRLETVLKQAAVEEIARYAALLDTKVSAETLTLAVSKVIEHMHAAEHGITIPKLDLNWVEMTDEEAKAAEAKTGE